MRKCSSPHARKGRHPCLPDKGAWHLAWGVERERRFPTRIDPPTSPRCWLPNPPPPGQRHKPVTVRRGSPLYPPSQRTTPYHPPPRRRALGTPVTVRGLAVHTLQAKGSPPTTHLLGGACTGGPGNCTRGRRSYTSRVYPPSQRLIPPATPPRRGQKGVCPVNCTRGGDSGWVRVLKCPCFITRSSSPRSHRRLAARCNVAPPPSGGGS